MKKGALILLKILCSILLFSLILIITFSILASKWGLKKISYKFISLLDINITYEDVQISEEEISSIINSDSFINISATIFSEILYCNINEKSLPEPSELEGFLSSEIKNLYQVYNYKIGYDYFESILLDSSRLPMVIDTKNPYVYCDMLKDASYSDEISRFSMLVKIISNFSSVFPIFLLLALFIIFFILLSAISYSISKKCFYNSVILTIFKPSIICFLFSLGEITSMVNQTHLMKFIFMIIASISLFFLIISAVFYIMLLKDKEYVLS